MWLSNSLTMYIPSLAALILRAIDVGCSRTVEHQTGQAFRSNLALVLLDIRGRRLVEFASVGPPSAQSIRPPLVFTDHPGSRKRTHEPSSLLKISGGTTTCFLRLSVDVEVRLGTKTLDLVDLCFQFLAFEDRSGSRIRVMIGKKRARKREEPVKSRCHSSVAPIAPSCHTSHSHSRSRLSSSPFRTP